VHEIRDLAECDLRLPGNSPDAYRTHSGQYEVLPRIVAVVDEHFVGGGDLTRRHLLEPVPLLAHQVDARYPDRSRYE
jgi:hypothetical protein